MAHQREYNRIQSLTKVTLTMARIQSKIIWHTKQNQKTENATNFKGKSPSTDINSCIKMSPLKLQRLDKDFKTDPWGKSKCTWNEGKHFLVEKKLVFKKELNGNFRTENINWISEIKTPSILPPSRAAVWPGHGPPLQAPSSHRRDTERSFCPWNTQSLFPSQELF